MLSVVGVEMKNCLKTTNLQYVHVSAIFNKVTLGSKSSKRKKPVRGRSAIRKFYTDIVILLCDVSIVSITVVRNLSLVRRTGFNYPLFQLSLIFLLVFLFAFSVLLC